MNKYLKTLILFILVILTACFLYFITPLVLDGIWNYGFGYNISKGLIPYKDFNMVVTPLFPYILAPFIKIVGNKFITYYIIIAFIIVTTTNICYKKIGWKAIIIYFLLLLYPHNGYNTFAVLLLFILLKNIEKEKNNDILTAIIISIMFLTKQTLGLLMIPNIIYSKNKKKTIAVYLITFLSLILYLLINNNLYQFIDYCFLGMFDFGSKNNTGIDLLRFLEIGLCIYMAIKLIKSKFKDKPIFYILLFQIISFPITDNSHFVLTSSPIVYYIYNNYKNKYFIYFFSILVISFIIGFNIYIYYGYNNINYKNSNSFINYKSVSLDYPTYFNNIEKYRNMYKDYRLYLLDTRAYVGKLEFNIKIDKYDLINEGNMGYKGIKEYIKEIDEYCKNNKCLFIINVLEGTEDINQTNKEIINYVMYNYYNISSSWQENVYINKM